LLILVITLYGPSQDGWSFGDFSHLNWAVQAGLVSFLFLKSLELVRWSQQAFILPLATFKC
jgi:hypothetical protein